MRKVSRIQDNISADSRLGNFLAVFGIFIITIIMIFSSTNAVSTGVGIGKIPPNIISQSHAYGDASNVWNDFNLYSHFDQNWSGNHTEGKFILIEFLDTDCPHCWSDASTMFNIQSDIETYGITDRVELFVVATQLSIPSHETSREEIVAFQEKTNFLGCKGGNYNCMDREGGPHKFHYIDDINTTIVSDWDLPGTPFYVILSPNGIIVWDTLSAEQEETAGIALAKVICKDGGDVSICGE